MYSQFFKCVLKQRVRCLYVHWGQFCGSWNHFFMLTLVIRRCLSVALPIYVYWKQNPQCWICVKYIPVNLKLIWDFSSLNSSRHLPKWHSWYEISFFYYSPFIIARQGNTVQWKTEKEFNTKQTGTLILLTPQIRYIFLFRMRTVFLSSHYLKNNKRSFNSYNDAHRVP